MKKALSVLLLTALLILPVLRAPAEASLPRPRLVQTVTEYSTDFETGEWEAVRTWDFTYENGYPVSVDLHELDADLHVVTTFAYEFSGGVPTRRQSYDADGNLLSVTEYNEGRVYNVTTEDAGHSYGLYYQYGNGDEYFTLVLREEHSCEKQDGESLDFHAEEVDAVSVTAKDGLLVKTVNTGMYANWGGGEAKEWMRFSGTYTADYDADGLVVLTSAVHRVGPSGVDGRYELTRADGLVTEAVQLSPSQDGDWLASARFTFAYTDTETTAPRYAQMINSFLMGSESSYYKYNWY